MDELVCCGVLLCLVSSKILSHLLDNLVGCSFRRNEPSCDLSHQVMEI